MERGIEHSGAWAVALIVIVIASWLLYRYLAPKTWREWAGAGLIQAFIIALYAEMYGFPLGMAVVTPNLLTAISLHNNRKTGQNLAALSSFNGLGQIAGPIYGTWIFTRGEQLPFTTIGSIENLSVLANSQIHFKR